jgi:hypothetical protein
MKQWTLLLFSIAVGISSFAQKSKINWGEEFKLRKGSTDLQVVYSDKSGVYLQEGHLALKSYFVIGATTRSSAALVKLDKNLSEIYHNDFNRELKGKEFEQFFIVQDKLYLFASENNRREKTLTIFGAEVNKQSGELGGTWQPVTTFQRDEKNDDVKYKLTLNADSSKLVVVSSVEGKEKNTYQVQEFDKTLRKTTKPVIITNEFDAKTFQLEDVLYTTSKKIIMVGRVLEYVEGKKKKEKFIDFAKYIILFYNETGKQETEINTDINGKWLTSTKLVQERDRDLVLAAFYTNKRKGKTIDGILVQRINPITGQVISTSQKDIDNSLLATETDESSDDEDAGETKAERKERERLDKLKDEGEAFSRYMMFRKIFYTSDNGLVVMAEKFHHYTVQSQRYSPGINGGPGSWHSSTYAVYESGDLLTCKIDATGNIAWLEVLPKAQREVIGGSQNSNGPAPSPMVISFFESSGMPYYSGFAAIQSEGYINVIFNDNPKNAIVTKPGQKIKMVRSFGKSDCFVFSIDEVTGKNNRKFFFTNTDVPTSMPRLGAVVGQEMYIVGKQDRIFGKTKIAVAKISVR